jgi:hypothetical protein
MTYATLQTDIANYLHRTDLTSKIPTFITTAESYLFRELVIKELQTSTSLTSTGEYVTLPSDFSAVARITVTVGGIDRTLDYKSQLDTITPNSGFPYSYSLENNELRLWGAGTGTVCTLYYSPKISNLSVSASTNWLLENGYDLYLYASALEGAKYVRNQQQIDALTPMVLASLDSVRRFSERRGLPSVGSLQIKAAR